MNTHNDEKLIGPQKRRGRKVFRNGLRNFKAAPDIEKLSVSMEIHVPKRTVSTPLDR